jgi:hypothetical protein
MANSTLLVLVQHALQAMGVVAFDQPSTVIANSNQDITQTLALINIEADAIARGHEWQALKTQALLDATFFSYTGNTTADSTSLTSMSSIVSLTTDFAVTGLYVPQDSKIAVTPAGTTVVLNREATTSAATSTFTFSKVLFDKPAGFSRQIDRTQWDKDQRWELLGPLTEQQSSWLRSGYISSGPRVRYWWENNQIRIWPPLGANKTLSFSYLSKYWVAATGTDAGSKQYFTVDTDTCIFPDALMHALIRLKYFQVKGMDTAALNKDYKEQLDLAKSYNAGNQTLSIAPAPADILIGIENVPDSGYGPQ